LKSANAAGAASSKPLTTGRNTSQVRFAKASRYQTRMRPYYYLGRNWALTQLSNGLPFFVNTDDRGISTWIILGGTWENFVDDVMQEILRPKDVCLDLGANLGYYTIKMAHVVGPEGRVLAFEPNSELYPFLIENVSINNFARRVTTYPMAVGVCAGSGSLKFDYSNMGGGYIETGGSGSVEIVAIDELADVPQRVDFIKIDVEGMEPLAFAGMARLLERSPDCAIITEFSKGHWQRFCDPVKLLDEVGGSRLKLWIEHDGILVNCHADSPRNGDSISYVLLIHENDERYRRIKHRIRFTARKERHKGLSLIVEADGIAPEMPPRGTGNDEVTASQHMLALTKDVSALESILKQYSRVEEIRAQNVAQMATEDNCELKSAELFDVSSIARLTRSRAESEIRARCRSVYLGRDEVLCRCLGKYKIFLDCRDVGFSPHIILDGYWEYWITRFMVSKVQPGFWVLDIGANFGYYTLLLSDLVSDFGHCIAFEPNPQVTDKLRKSIEINGFEDRTQVKQVALGREPWGEACLYIPHGEPKNARIVPVEYRFSANEDQMIKVPRARVDTLLKDIDRLDFVKIDAEGAEADIVVGMERTLRRLKPMLLIEFNASRGYNGRNLVQLLIGIYGSLMYVDFDAELKQVSIEELLEKNVGHDWMLFFHQKAVSSS
jgi:FkbM family methyltransferase